ncbi:MAG: hypothetical protein U0M66_06795 [Bacilli bacterium]|nr:hypothetical protein [Bacilli bacterium]
MNEVTIEKQPVLSKILNKINRSSVNTQAYLLVGRSKEKLNSYVLTLSKVLICPNKYEENCKNCNICRRIDEGVFGELKIIAPVNKVIKKDAVISLRDAFQTRSIEGKNLVYIINDVDALNSSAANSLLKFLEEPSGNTVAIFTTTNYNMVMDTIVSRCQVIKVNNELDTNKENLIKQITGLEQENIDKVISMLLDVELKPTMAMAKMKEDFLSVFSDREQLQRAVLTIILIYKDILNYKVCGNLEYFNKESLKNIIDNQKIDVLTKKITFVLENMNKLDYNVNTLLFMDNLLIGIGEIQNGKSSRS